MNNIQKHGINTKNVSFTGHSKKLDNQGLLTHRFYYMYDNKRYNCALELYNISKDKDLNILVSQDPVKEIDMKDAPFVDLGQFDNDSLNQELGFAYRFKLTDKSTGEISYGFDNGQVVGILDKNKGSQYNIVLNNRAIINKNGPMQLIMPDEYYPGVARSVDGSLYVADELRTKAKKSVRNHANKLGGGFIGIIKRLQDGQIRNEGVKRIVGTPFTKDSISSHLYWTENAFQVAPTLGNENDFKQLQVELFKNGINWIADAALVNEGYGGIHMSELLRKGQDSISKNMFRVESDVVSLGILPKEASAKGYTSVKLINTPFVVDENGQYSKSNPNYDASKPTYIQFFDNRLASKSQQVSGTSYDNRTEEEKKNAPQPPFDLTTYANTNTKNIYDITRHYDAVYPFYIEVNPQQLERNVAQIYNQNGEVNLSDIITIKNISNFPNFRVENKSKASDIEFWDGNVDIAKLNFFRCNQDDKKFTSLPIEQRKEAIKDFENGTLAVREYAVNMGKYWTKLTADTQFEYASKEIASKHANTAEEYMQAIEDGVKAGELPPDTLDVVNIDVVKEVLDGNYFLPKLESADIRDNINPEIDYNEYKSSDYMLKKAMEVQFETLPIATNLLGIITSPYIQKKPYNEDEIAVSRYDIYKAGNPNLPEKYADVYNKSDKLYTESIFPVVNNVLSGISGITNEDGTVSEYGRYVITEAMPDIVRYILTKALDNSADIKINADGTLDFTNVDPANITMQSLGIPFDTLTSEDEANQLLNSLRAGIETSKNNGNIAVLKKAIEKRFENRTLNDFKIAEMIIDRTESGLGWRIDATKDVASMDAVRNGMDTMPSAWMDTISIWKLFNQSVLKENRHAYTTAEITDLADLFRGQPESSFGGSGDAERKFLQETGITSVANYNYFFSFLPELFSLSSIQDGAPHWSAMLSKNDALAEKLIYGWEDVNGFLFQSPEDGVINSYTFVGNHDKPRALHGLALDMSLFHYGCLSKKEEAALRKEFIDSNGYYETRYKVIATRINKIKMAEMLLNKPIDDYSLQKALLSIRESSNPSEELDIIDQYFDTLKIDSEVKELMDNEDLSKYSSEAFAMGIRMKQVLDKMDIDDAQKQEISSAILDLAKGNFKGKTFAPLAFGTRKFEDAIKSVFDQIEYKTRQPVENRTKLEAEILQGMLEPAFDRFLSIYKTMITLPGSPTDFGGDRIGLTGYETKCKNDYQQNRNVINWEYLNKTKEDGSLNEEYKDYIAEFYNKMNEIAKFRSNPKLSPLNDGATIFVPMYKYTDKGEVDKNENGNPNFDNTLHSLIRYNDEGNIVIAIMNSAGSSAPNTEKMERGKKLSNKLHIASNKDHRIGLKFGLKEGTIFKNPTDNNDTIYTVKKDENGYYLEKTVNGKVKPIEIEAKDLNTLLLYKD